MMDLGPEANLAYPNKTFNLNSSASKNTLQKMNWELG